MPEFTLTNRSFNSQQNFGAGGFFYRGDGRGFSLDDGKTSRIKSTTTFDIEENKIISQKAVSDASQNGLFRGLKQNYSSTDTQPTVESTCSGTPLQSAGYPTHRCHDAP